MNIPLFPLGTVLFPGGLLPLQIFEVRYLDMVRRCHRDGKPFGVVCLKQGHEVQQPDPGHGGFAQETFHQLGTLARIIELVQPQPGLLVIQCQGEARFQIDHHEKLKHGLWMAEVQPLPADQAVPLPAELRGIPAALHQLHTRLQAEQPGMVAQLPAFTPGEGLWDDAGWVANRWAELLPLPPDAKQRLLALDSPLLRLELVGDALEQLGLRY